MNGVSWDPPAVYAILARLSVQRARYRVRRLFERMRSPRRLVATTLTVAFFAVYLLNGFFVFANRTPADPERLRLWLSGGMVIYAIYHFTRCAWGSTIPDLQLTAAEQLWLGGGPLRRSSLALYHLTNIFVASLLKSLLLVVLLACDVPHWGLLLIGVFTSLVLLEAMRLILERAVAGIDQRQRRWLKAMTGALMAALVAQILSRVFSATPWGSPTWRYLLSFFAALGEVASSDVVQWMAIPWLPAAGLAVTEQLSGLTLTQFLGSISLIPLAVLTLVNVDRWSREACHRREQRALQRRPAFSARRRKRALDSADASDQVTRWLVCLPQSLATAAALMTRQWVTVKRYAGSIVFSFAIPVVLSLSPIMTGRGSEAWLYVVAGIALCTVLLAPPALRIDFRRDLKRMLLLRGLPVSASSIVLGQLLLPILITIGFQLLTLGIAGVLLRPAPFQLTLWTGILSALAVSTFAMENALFLAFPHHERAEGIAMMIRAKLTFLGKGVLLAGAVALLVAWATLCRAALPDTISTAVFVAGSIVATWAGAVACFASAAWAWSRFDLAHDTPPE